MPKIQIDFPEDLFNFMMNNKKLHKVSVQSFVVIAAEEKMLDMMEIRKKVAMRYFASEELKSKNIKNP